MRLQNCQPKAGFTFISASFSLLLLLGLVWLCGPHVVYMGSAGAFPFNHHRWKPESKRCDQRKDGIPVAHRICIFLLYAGKNPFLSTSCPAVTYGEDDSLGRKLCWLQAHFYYCLGTSIHYCLLCEWLRYSSRWHRGKETGCVRDSGPETESFGVFCC